MATHQLQTRSSTTLKPIYSLTNHKAPSKHSTIYSSPHHYILWTNAKQQHFRKPFNTKRTRQNRHSNKHTALIERRDRNTPGTHPLYPTMSSVGCSGWGVVLLYHMRKAAGTEFRVSPRRISPGFPGCRGSGTPWGRVKRRGAPRAAKARLQLASNYMQTAAPICYCAMPGAISSLIVLEMHEQQH